MLNRNILALDVGERRIGVAMADTQVKIAVPFGWLDNDEQIMTTIAELLIRHDIHTLVIGYPRNQSGEATKQTEYIEKFAKRLEAIEIKANIYFQDESLTSVVARERLGAKIKHKGEIDAEAASVILQDYLEG